MTKAVFARPVIALRRSANFGGGLWALLLCGCRAGLRALPVRQAILIPPLLCATLLFWAAPSLGHASLSAASALPGHAEASGGILAFSPLHDALTPRSLGSQLKQAALSDPVASRILQYWDGADTIGNGKADGGDGEWNASAANWTGGGDGQNPDFSLNAPWQGAGAAAVFAGLGGVVTVQEVQDFDSLQFRSDGYRITGGELRVSPYAGDSGTVDVAEGVTASIASAFSGGGLIKTGAGELLLQGENQYSGKTEIREGRLVGGGANNFSPASMHEITGGELVVGSGPQHIGGLSGNGGALDLGASSLIVGQESEASFSGALKGGAGSVFRLEGGGELALMNIDDFSGAFALAEGASLELSGRAGLVVNAPLSGEGTLALRAGAAADELRFGEGVGRDFAGRAELRRGRLELDDAAESALAKAALSVKAGASAALDQNRAVRALELDGGELRYTYGNGRPAALLSVEDLAVTDKGASVVLEHKEQSQVRALLPDLDRNLYDYSGAAAETLLIAASGKVSGSAGRIAFLDADGARLDEARETALEQNGDRVGTAVFGLGAALVDSGENKGLYYKEGLTELEASRGKSVVLDSDKASSDSPRLEARLAGQGGFTFTGAKRAGVGNALSSYTGPTRVEGADLVFEADNAFGKTESLHIDAQGKVDLNGHSQTVGALSGPSGASLSLGPGKDRKGGLIVDQSVDSSYGGVIEGYGDLQKLGEGRLALSGKNSFSGKTEVRAGVLAVQGRLESPTVNVRNGASLSLSSSATIQGNVQVSGGGELVLGNGGALEGDLSMAQSSVIAARNDNKALAVEGKVGLSDDMRLELRGADWTTGRYELLSAANPADLSAFSGIFVPGLVEEYSVENDSGTLVLRYTERNPGKLSSNQKRLFATLAEMDKSSPMYQALSGVESSALGSALDMLSGEMHSSLRNSLSLIDRGFSKRLSRHISQASLNRRPILTDESSYMDPGDYDRFATYSGNYYGSNYSLWAGVGGTHAAIDAKNGAAKSSLEGPEVAVGLDALLDDGVMLGGALQYSYKDLEVDGRKSDADIHSYTIGLYAGRELPLAGNVLRLLMGGSYSYHDIDSTREVRVSAVKENLEAEYKANSANIYAEAAYSMVIAEKFHAEPFLNVGWNWLRTDKFTEEGGQAALKGGSKPSDIFISLLGLRFDLPLLDVLHLNASVGWEHLYGNLDQSLRLGFHRGGDSFRVKGNSLSRDELSLGLGAALNLSDSLSVKIDYDGGIGKDSETHGGSATLIYRW